MSLQDNTFEAFLKGEITQNVVLTEEWLTVNNSTVRTIHMTKFQTIFKQTLSQQIVRDIS